MRFDIVTLFPELFVPFLQIGVLGRAMAAGIVSYRLSTPRAFAKDQHGTVDDAPYGGGTGMVMMPGPIADALDALDASASLPKGRRVLLTPTGKVFSQSEALRLASLQALTLVCGRYEGIDERIRAIVDEEISVGDFVLCGGEIAAMTVIEATSRHVPGVLGNSGSLAEESYTAGLLEYPQYTRPLVFRGMEVPAVLRSGNHAAIARWRRKEALRRTRERRPDLMARLRVVESDRMLLSEIELEEKV